MQTYFAYKKQNVSQIRLIQNFKDIQAIGTVQKKGYSGTAIFTKQKPINVTYGIGIEEHDKEGRVITLEFEKFYMVDIYTPNSKRELERLEYRQIWEDEIRKYLLKLNETKPVGT